MNEPRPEDFGLLKVSQNEYKLINMNAPKLEDFKLTNEIISKHTEDSIQKISDRIYFIFIITVLFLFFHTQVLSCFVFLIDTFKNGDIITGLLLLFFAYPMLFCFIYFISIVAGMPLFNLILKQVVNYLNHHSPDYNNTILYRQKLNDFEKELRTKTADYIKAKDQYILNEKRKLVNYWMSLDGRKFEVELSLLFQKNGYQVKLTPATNDKGIDIILHKNGKKIIVQCKALAKPASPHVVRDLYGTLVASKANKAILACTSGFTKGVYEYVRDKAIELMDVNDIINLQKKSIETPPEQTNFLELPQIMDILNKRLTNNNLKK